MILQCLIIFQDPSTVQQSNFHTPKARKSLAEKIGKTLDKLTTNHHSNNHSGVGHHGLAGVHCHQVKHQALPPSVASTAAWIYPATFYQQHPQPRIGENFLLLSHFMWWLDQ